MSERASIASPSACSGDMNDAVPRIMPAPLAGPTVRLSPASRGVTIFASPKSRIFTSPSAVIITLPGFEIDGG